LRDILQQTRQGKQVDSAQIRKPRFVIDQKQTAVADKPSLAGQWRNIDNQLAVVEWWNRYSELQKKAQGNATSHRRAVSLSSEISGSEDTGTVALDWDPSGNGQDLAPLKDRLSQTAGLDKMTIITPENKRLTLANTNKPSEPSHDAAPRANLWGHCLIASDSLHMSCDNWCILFRWPGPTSTSTRY
jgi:hypothetical protein